jgi:transposase
MPAKKYRVKLPEEQRATLGELTSRGITPVRKHKRARVLLLVDENSDQGRKNDPEVGELVGLSPSTVQRIRRQFVEEGLEATLNQPGPGMPRIFDDKDRAAIVALARSEPPEGHARWTLRLLADKLVELEIVDSISYHAVGGILKETK